VNERERQSSYIEPDAETVKRREIIIAMADFVAELSAPEGQSLALKMGFPLELVPLLTKFTQVKIQTDDILKAWRGLGGNPANQ
jgi:hypothetical protein